ncbi:MULTISPECIES: group I truncated hemoglobin [Thalassolituus]|uniref:group I truncated hemoglobin n=1 Tax=Thalassolituus TaxID=187492 RepID=UPI000C6A3712|nr:MULTISPECIES: group 1 truncated hemoglobin [Thalassolituus]MAX86791.1 group 1 truncated hemoglobin [Oceanospirillaceae bacterium]MEC9254962.1 group 1 truncated hemoglobin [Pseudomonadota bacterium]|tara:strand:+ start:8993 stop:9415 length:423 start_codon:yes stop_codon:yes gene_type:complete
MIKKLIYIAALFSGLTCFNVAQADGYYQELGGKEGVEKIVDNFINEISFDQNIVKFFEGTDITRLREKLIEQFCHESGGPCEYTGDSMKDVHAGMKITKAEFNRVVELLQAAMDDAGTPQTAQNRLIRSLAPMRPDIIHQ